MRRKVVAIHIGMTSVLMCGLMLLFKYVDRARSKTLYHTVHLSGLTVVSAFGYYMLFELLRALAPPSWGLARRGDGRAYSAMNAQSEQPLLPEKQAEQIEGQEADERAPEAAPQEACIRLDMRNIWGLVYGLGCVFFVGAYCLSGQQLACSYFFALGLSCVCFQEILLPVGDSEFAVRQRMLEALAVLMSFLSTVLVGVIWRNQDKWGKDWADVTFSSVLTGAIMPFVAPLILGTLKTPTGYCVGGMMELCEFGFPFMFILGFVYIGVVDGQNMHITMFMRLNNMKNNMIGNQTTMFFNATDSWGWSDFGDMALIAGCAPLLFIPCLVFITTAVMRDHSSDPLVSISLITAGGLALDQGMAALHAPLTVAALVLAKMSLIIRFVSTSYDPSPRCILPSA